MILAHKPFYFLRHGETDWNSQGLFMGSQNIPLNQVGIKQAHTSAQGLKNEQISYIVSSPSLRALETAKIISTALEKPLTVIDELRERCLGDMEGKSIDSIQTQWFSDSMIVNGEKMSEFQTRLAIGLKKALELPGPVLIVSHGGVYLVLQEMMSWPVVHLKNCASVFHRPPEHSSHPWFICHLTEEYMDDKTLENSLKSPRDLIAGSSSEGIL